MTDKWDEESFQKRTGHRSLCNCVRRWKGKLIITRRHCDCGTKVMTREKAFSQAVSELGALSETNHKAIIKRVKELEGARP